MILTKALVSSRQAFSIPECGCIGYGNHQTSLHQPEERTTSGHCVIGGGADHRRGTRSRAETHGQGEDAGAFGTDYYPTGSPAIHPEDETHRGFRSGGNRPHHGKHGDSCADQFIESKKKST